MNLARKPGELVIDTVQYTDRFGGHEVAGDQLYIGIVQRTRRQSSREQCFEIAAYLPVDASNRTHRFIVRDASRQFTVPMERSNLERGVDLFTSAVNDD